jgi:hypothetical protein
MRLRTLALAAAWLPLAACTTAAAHTPAYAVLSEASSIQADHTRAGSADLLMLGATHADARAAISDYTARIRPGAALMYVKVIHTPGASRYVCRARWYANAQAFTRYGHGPQPGTWPALDITCP